MAKGSSWGWGSPPPKQTSMVKLPESISLPPIPKQLKNIKLPKLPKLTRTQTYMVIGAATLGGLLLLRSLSNAAARRKLENIPSPKDIALLQRDAQDVSKLPYPPNALPGARDVDSPYGTTRVYEWGPEDGERVLIIHGMSTPCVAFAEIATRLSQKGHRVMLFDLFAHGYSSAPSASRYPYDGGLYMSQILICLRSSSIPWNSFTLVGYSLGGALAADFASYFPHDLKGLVLVCPAGLIRTNHVSWTIKVMCHSGGLVPEWLVESVMKWLLWKGPESAKAIEPEADVHDEWETASISSSRSGDRKHPRERKRSSAPVPLHQGVLHGNPESTVSNIVNWQIQNHRGFVPAFISSIRNAPISNQHHRWEVIRNNIEMKRGGVRRVYMLLAEKDPMVVCEEVAEDTKAVLGEENVKIRIIKGIGHELPLSRPDEVVEAVRSILKPRKRR